MTNGQLKGRIRLVLSQVKTEALYTVPQTAKSVSGPARSGVTPRVYLPGQATLSSEQVNLLRLMYAQAKRDEQEKFCELLRECLAEMIRAGANPSTAVIGHVLADLHCLKDIEVDDELLGGVWRGWQQRLEHASETFSDEELTALLKAKAAAFNRFPRIQQGSSFVIRVPLRATRLSHALSAVEGLIQLVRYERLKKHLVEGHNPEINTDRETVVSRLAALGFPKDVEDALEEVDAKLRAADSPFDFKGCIDLVRTVFEGVLQHSAVAVSRKASQSLPAGPSVGNFAPYTTGSGK